MHVVCFIQNSHDGGRGRVLPPTTCEARARWLWSLSKDVKARPLENVHTTKFRTRPKFRTISVLSRGRKSYPRWLNV